MKNKGFTLIELLVVILIIGILLALIIPNFVLFQERARRASVKNNMHVVQTAMEAYAVDHFGNYPTTDADWTAEDDLFWCYFPGGDPVGLSGSPLYGRPPINPYTGGLYNLNEDGNQDMFYDPEFVDESGALARVRGDDAEECPWLEHTPDEEFQGSIFVGGWIPETSPMECAQEYGICGWGRDLTNPMFDRDPMAEADDYEMVIFFILHN
jgi:prepilin-type N-terminal cleavage/methylation domain-containing protein